MSFRNFSPELEKLATEWAEAESPITTDEWLDLGVFGGSEAKPIKVQRVSDKRNGIAKPCKLDPAVAHAAHEKIASDLAYHLGLPVPPVILWDRKDDALPQRYVCISAWAFSSDLHWGQIESQFTSGQLAQAKGPFSAILPFETWIYAGEDRKAEHVKVHINTGDGSLQLAFIDYAFSLSKYWVKSEISPVLASPSKFLPASVGMDNDAALQICDKLETFDPGLIDHIIGRIPEDYLTSLRKDTIKFNLKDRTRRVRAMLGL